MDSVLWRQPKVLSICLKWTLKIELDFLVYLGWYSSRRGGRAYTLLHLPRIKQGGLPVQVREVFRMLAGNLREPAKITSISGREGTTEEKK